MAVRNENDLSSEITIHSEELSLGMAFHSEWLRNNFPFGMVFHSEWLRNNPKGPHGPIPPKGAEGALGPLGPFAPPPWSLLALGPFWGWGGALGGGGVGVPGVPLGPRDRHLVEATKGRLEI